MLGSRARRLLQGGVIGGVALTSGSLGYLLHGNGVVSKPIVVHVKPLQGIQTGSQSSSVMPSLGGLSEQSARAALATTGVAQGSIVTRTSPAATTPGLVVAQVPDAGVTIDAGSNVTLVLSARATMPSLVGGSETQGRAQLQKLGADVRSLVRYSPGKKPGTVLQTLPAAGKPLVDQATLVIAQAPSSAYLTDLRPITQGCSSSDTDTINGSSVSNNLRCNASASSTNVSEYQLDRRVSTISMLAGQDDRGAAGFTVRVRVVGDGKLLASKDLPFGSAARISANVVGKLRLRIEVTVLRGPTECCSSATVILGEARIIGDPTSINQLVAASGG